MFSLTTVDKIHARSESLIALAPLTPLDETVVL